MLRPGPEEQRAKGSGIGVPAAPPPPGRTPSGTPVRVTERCPILEAHSQEVGGGGGDRSQTWVQAKF